MPDDEPSVPADALLTDYLAAVAGAGFGGNLLAAARGAGYDPTATAAGRAILDAPKPVQAAVAAAIPARHAALAAPDRGAGDGRPGAGPDLAGQMHAAVAAELSPEVAATLADEFADIGDLMGRLKAAAGPATRDSREAAALTALLSRLLRRTLPLDAAGLTAMAGSFGELYAAPLAPHRGLCRQVEAFTKTAPVPEAARGPLRSVAAAAARPRPGWPDASRWAARLAAALDAPPPDRTDAP